MSLRGWLRETRILRAECKQPLSEKFATLSTMWHAQKQSDDNAHPAPRCVIQSQANRMLRHCELREGREGGGSAKNNPRVSCSGRVSRDEIHIHGVTVLEMNAKGLFLLSVGKSESSLTRPDFHRSQRESIPRFPTCLALKNISQSLSRLTEFVAPSRSVIPFRQTFI